MPTAGEAIALPVHTQPVTGHETQTLRPGFHHSSLWVASNKTALKYENFKIKQA